MRQLLVAEGKLEHVTLPLRSSTVRATFHGLTDDEVSAISYGHAYVHCDRSLPPSLVPHIDPCLACVVQYEPQTRDLHAIRTSIGQHIAVFIANYLCSHVESLRPMVEKGVRWAKRRIASSGTVSVVSARALSVRDLHKECLLRLSVFRSLDDSRSGRRGTSVLSQTPLAS